MPSEIANNCRQNGRQQLRTQSQHLRKHCFYERNASLKVDRSYPVQQMTRSPTQPQQPDFHAFPQPRERPSFLPFSRCLRIRQHTPSVKRTPGWVDSHARSLLTRTRMRQEGDEIAASFETPSRLLSLPKQGRKVVPMRSVSRN